MSADWASGTAAFAGKHDGFLSGLELYTDRPDKAWSLVDCVSFKVMRARGLKEALAHDEHFEQAGFVALLRAGA